MKTTLGAFPPMFACTVVLLACLVGGGALVWAAKRALQADLRNLNAANKERKTAQEQHARLVLEAREIEQHLAIWHRLSELRIVGEERRLEWLDALARIRAARALHDLRYQIEPQRPSKAERAQAPLEVRSSTMKVEMALLHEGELLRFLDDLRGSGNAYYAIRRCSIHRLTPIAGPAVAPSLRAKCEIDLVTMAPGKGRT